jgi:hypothetical protein
MKTDAYTPEAICKSMGIASFERDPCCISAAEAVRLLLKPSFHPEICITFADGKVSVVSARAMIWRQFEPSPMVTDRAEGTVEADAQAGLLTSMIPLAHPGAVSGIAIDGMPVDLLHFQGGSIVLSVEGNGGRQGDFSAFVALAICTAWECVSNPYCRNALAEAAEYVGKSLPREKESVRKQTIETMVLGPEEDRAQLLEALRKHRNG